MPENPKPAPSSALAEFGMLTGLHAGEHLPVLAPVVTIGQGPQNDVVLVDDSVSRTHARLEYLLEGWRLTDLESTNGTIVEGVRLAPGVPTPLSYGSTVRFGGVQLEFREVAEADPDAARAAFASAIPSAPPQPWRFRLPLWLFIIILIILAVALFFLFAPADVGAALP